MLGAIVNSRLAGGLAEQLKALGIPASFRSLVIDAVTHGGLPSSASAASNPAARGHEALVRKVLAAAEHAAGRGVHLALLVAAGIVLAAGIAALLAVRPPRDGEPGEDASAPLAREREAEATAAARTRA